MTTTVTFGGQDRQYTLTSAILIYEDTSHNAAATVHSVTIDGRGARPNLLPGQPLTMTALEGLLNTLTNRVASNGFIDARILSMSMNRLLWFCPASRQRIWFKPSNAGDDPQGVLKAANGRFAWHPPLLFRAENRSLAVWALLDNHRPRLNSRLWRAPYWNLGDGHMCNGNLDLPAVAPENIAGFERAFFNSAFTHSSEGRLTCFKGGHNALWDHLTKRKTAPPMRFWADALVRGDKTIEDVLKS
jgi:PRTRC genetic system protein B